MNLIAVAVLVLVGLGWVALLAVHGYVMSEGRAWVAIVQPLVVIAGAALIYWAVTTVSPQ
jgi:hypothetical protein